MKKTLNIGSYGWCHSHWLNTFYPEDLPIVAEEDWRLAYYSNEFTTVLVPADYWQVQNDNGVIADSERWIDDVGDEFQFFVECHSSMLEHFSMSEILRRLQILQPQLSGLVFLETTSKMPKALYERFLNLASELKVDVLSRNIEECASKNQYHGGIWQKDNQCLSSFAWLEDDLTNLRVVRTIVDEFMSHIANMEQQSNEANMIIHHANLYPKDLRQFRAVLEIMGY